MTAHHKTSKSGIYQVHEYENVDGEEAPIFVLVTTYFGYLIVIIFGHLRDYFGKIFTPSAYKHLKTCDGIAPLTSDFESFYTRRLYARIKDCWNRPTTGLPGREIEVLEREMYDKNMRYRLTGNRFKLLNLSSYNYLGFAQNKGPCADAAEEALRKYKVGVSSTRLEGGNLSILQELEQTVARFLDQQDAIVFSMGFATNSTNLPAIVGKGCLIISDSLNHSSLVFGSRLSGATIKVFHHNDIHDLERLLREEISKGQPRTHRPWKKILVIVEGIYSMEGQICRLREIVALKEKYKFYIFLDEAHSIGALGPSGKGVTDVLGIPRSKIDVLMGTFTKSFGAAGGYIAGSKDLIDNLRLFSHSCNYSEVMSPVVAAQALAALKIVMGEDGGQEGQNRLKAIRENSNYFQRRLRDMGFIVYGDSGSPVVPLLLFNPAKIAEFSRECMSRGLAVVVVGYPATPIISSRVRFCISASHTREDLDFALDKISQVGDLLMLKLR